jgi:hypothetical protein
MALSSKFTFKIYYVLAVNNFVGLELWRLIERECGEAVIFRTFL